jgi:hypothetical protein
VHTPEAQALLDAGFVLLDSFRRPHFTIRLVDDSAAEASRLLNALGPPIKNPYNRTASQRLGETR